MVVEDGGGWWRVVEEVFSFKGLLVRGAGFTFRLPTGL
jgi:hypothetical protein